jgi:hypothetical protein
MYLFKFFTDNVYIVYNIYYISPIDSKLVKQKTRKKTIHLDFLSRTQKQFPVIVN